MSSSRRIQRDDFDIESKESYGAGVHRRPSEKRSRSRRRSYSRYRDDYSRSRSRSLERNAGRRVGIAYRRGRYPSRSRSRSRSRGYSRRHNEVNRSSRRHRDTRSRSYSRSRSRSRSQSRSPAYYRRNRNRDYDNERDFRRLESISRSRSRSSSQYRDFSTRNQEKQNNDKESLKSIDEEDQDQESSMDSCDSKQKQLLEQQENLEDLPLPKQQKSDESSKPIYQFNDGEPIDRARIHREMEEKLRQTLAKEGKVYPPPKPEASHPVFANDGSFLELFKKMQDQQKKQSPKVANPAVPILSKSAVNPATAPYLVATAMGKSAPPPPMVGRRKGGKILKTGMVAKQKVQTDASNDPKDFWSIYLAEVNKYKNTACESDQANRPLLK